MMVRRNQTGHSMSEPRKRASWFGRARCAGVQGVPVPSGGEKSSEPSSGAEMPAAGEGARQTRRATPSAAADEPSTTLASVPCGVCALMSSSSAAVMALRAPRAGGGVTVFPDGETETRTVTSDVPTGGVHGSGRQPSGHASCPPRGGESGALGGWSATQS
ncbi:hypothetical protein T492DRAFT_1024270 [Pavlovales sp. CCMP2436]|nr:hypothetical protein T492DRAFT_1024270 [Pavlovales sp. CCMP2436]